VAPKLGDRLVVMIEQGEITKAAFNAVDKTIDNIIITVLFSHYKPNPYREIAEEQQ
jgi:hypothetical protein